MDSIVCIDWAVIICHYWNVKLNAHNHAHFLAGEDSKCKYVCRWFQFNRIFTLFCFVLLLLFNRSAIKALRPGGYLVYSTCTLSKAENNDVISHILDSCNNVLPVDLHTLVTSVSKEFRFAANVQQHELLVLPERGKAWGPMYISKLKKLWFMKCLCSSCESKWQGFVWLHLYKSNERFVIDIPLTISILINLCIFFLNYLKYLKKMHNSCRDFC